MALALLEELTGGCIRLIANAKGAGILDVGQQVCEMLLEQFPLWRSFCHPFASSGGTMSGICLLLLRLRLWLTGSIDHLLGDQPVVLVPRLLGQQKSRLGRPDGGHSSRLAGGLLSATPRCLLLRLPDHLQGNGEVNTIIIMLLL